VLLGLRPTLARQGLWLGTARVDDASTRPPEAGERLLADRMPPTRRRDFLAGRRAAHRALDAGGLPSGEILAVGRRPVLPDGSAGSISHSGRLAVALVADSRRFRALGCDLELRGLPLDAAHLVLTRDEQAWLQGDLDPERAERRLLAVFSAKEAAFKAFASLLPPAEAPATLLGIVTRPLPGGFRARSANTPGHPLAVRVRSAGPGVFSWTAAAAATPWR
jgi:enterobactin synthetase component D